MSDAALPAAPSPPTPPPMPALPRPEPAASGDSGALLGEHDDLARDGRDRALLGRLARYGRVYAMCLRTCLAREMEFRANFAFTTAATILWSGMSMVISGMVFGNVRQVAGWTLDEMFILTGSFLVVESLLSTVFQRNMQKLSDLVNKGELDFVLVKPISSQFLVSVRYVDFADLPTAVVGLFYVVVGVLRAGLQPGPLEMLQYGLLLLCALLSLYAIWFVTVTLALWTGRINNIAALIVPFRDLARVPTDVYSGLLKPLLTYGLPIATIATLPTKALLGLLDATMLPYQIGLTLALLWASHRFWGYSLRRYTSASS
ncbi:MAG: ABC-2 family transporter protein [Chloroflexi bacterium]|nr:ABC-2 family transporter protein [Chloroflexota bacterium]